MPSLPAWVKREKATAKRAEREQVRELEPTEAKADVEHTLRDLQRMSQLPIPRASVALCYRHPDWNPVRKVGPRPPASECPECRAEVLRRRNPRPPRELEVPTYRAATTSPSEGEELLTFEERRAEAELDAGGWREYERNLPGHLRPSHLLSAVERLAALNRIATDQIEDARFEERERREDTPEKRRARQRKHWHQVYRQQTYSPYRI